MKKFHWLQMISGLLIVLLTGCPDPASEPQITISSFSASPEWGDAPLSTKFAWAFTTTGSGKVTCTIYTSSDGPAAYTIDNCALSGEQPHVYAVAGAYKAKLVVTVGGKTAEALLDIYSNKITYAENTRFPEKQAGYIGSIVEDGKVTIQYAPGSTLPDYKAGDILMCQDGYGYLRKVVSTSQDGSNLVITTVQAHLDEAIKDAIFGVGNETLKIASAKCVDNCNMLESLLPLLKGDSEDFKTSLKVKMKPYKYKEVGCYFELSSLELEMILKVHIEFIIDNYNVKKFAYIVRHEINSYAPLQLKEGCKKEIPMWNIIIGTVPVGPLLIVLGFEPSIEVDFSLAGGVDVGINTNIYFESGYIIESGKDPQPIVNAEIKPKLTPAFNPSVEGTLKFSLVPNFTSKLYDLFGPGASLNPFIEGKYSIERDKQCLKCNFGATAEISGELDLFIKKFKVEYEMTLLEVPFYNQCCPPEADAGTTFWCSQDGGFPDSGPNDGEVDDASSDAGTTNDAGSLDGGPATWVDPTTGYIWQRVPAYNGNWINYDWKSAVNYCNNLNLDGITGFHLPTINQLRSIIRGCDNTKSGGPCTVTDDCTDFSCGQTKSCDPCEKYKGPTTDGCYLDPNLAVDKYLEGTCGWSQYITDTTRIGAFANELWGVNFENAGIGFNYKSYQYWGLRCVR